MSLDLHAHKVRLIKQQAERLGLENVETKALDARKCKSTLQMKRLIKYW